MTPPNVLFLLIDCLRADAVLGEGRRAQLVRQVDALPTVLDLVGAHVPDEIHGTSLAPALADDRPLGLEAFLRVRSDPRDRRVGWRTPDWKYVYAPKNPDVPAELYDLANDPAERDNLATRRPDVVRTLRQRIERLQDGHAAAESAMSAAEKADVEKRLEDLGYM